MPTNALVPIAGGDIAAGWTAEDTLGYYIHRGYAYLNGLLASAQDGATTQALLTVPGAARPAAPVSLTLYADAGTDYTQDVALQLPASYAATIHPDGTLTLDDPPPAQIVTAPSAGSYYFKDITPTVYPRYVDPMLLVLLLGNTRWPVAVPPGDSFVTGSLGAFLGGGDFTDVASNYAAHNERVHVGGTTRASIDGASTLLTSLPADAKAGLIPGDGYDTLVHGPGGEPLTLEVSTTQAVVSGDVMKPAGEPPPLSWRCPPFMARPGGANTEFGSGNILGLNFVAGQTLGAGPAITPGVYHDGASVDHGTYLCGGASCHAPGGLPSLSLDLDFLIASCDPLPDWFILRLSPSITVINPAQNGCVGGACGPDITVDQSFAVTAGTPSTYLTPTGATAPLTAGSPNYLAPSSPRYTGPTFLDPVYPIDVYPPGDLHQMLWQRGQLTGAIGLSFSAVINSGSVDAQLIIYPLYEQRQLGLHAGDMLDLSGAGWPGVIPDPVLIAPGQMVAGAHASGIIKRGGAQ